MASACPAPAPDAPIVRALLGSVDCNVGALVHTGYGALFTANGAFAAVLTAILTIYVAMVGFGLMTGRTPLRVSDVSLNLVKIGVIVGLATQWDAYQGVIYRFLFDGPQQIAGAMLAAGGAGGRADLMDNLQAAFDALNAYAQGYAVHVPGLTSPLLGGMAFAAFILTVSAGLMLLCTLGVLLAAKVVLGVLLAVGPIFLALFLFDSTRGVFEGWLRATLAFAIAPLVVSLVTSVLLVMLAPILAQMQALQEARSFIIAPAYSVALLVLVFAGVIAGALTASGMIATGFRLPARPAAAQEAPAVQAAARAEPALVDQPRAVRVATAAAALDRRDAAAAIMSESRSSDRRTSVTTQAAAGARADGGVDPLRLGQQPTRRRAEPRTRRTEALGASGGALTGRRGR